MMRKILLCECAVANMFRRKMPVLGIAYRSTGEKETNQSRTTTRCVFLQHTQENARREIRKEAVRSGLKVVARCLTRRWDKRCKRHRPSMAPPARRPPHKLGSVERYVQRECELLGCRCRDRARGGDRGEARSREWA